MRERERDKPKSRESGRESDRAIPWANNSGFRRSRAESSGAAMDLGGPAVATGGEGG